MADNQTPPPYGSYTPPPFDPNEYYGRNDPFASDAMGKSRGVTALLALLIGSLGIHYFYLGKTTGGLLTILLTIVTCGLWEIVVLIQGIMLFCMTNYDFDHKYVYNPSSFPVF